ncbi:hypothetical protein BX666DRAFT_1873581 [Dichotomocladium elegans]|nr:hypothetical protein BX666DRAFT_1873581 [Dichotomocladium elegans]
MNRPSTTSETNNGTSTKKAVFNYAAAVKRSSQIQDQPSSPTTTSVNNAVSAPTTPTKVTNGSTPLNSNGSTSPAASGGQQLPAASKEQHKNSPNAVPSPSGTGKSASRNTVQLPRAPPTDAAPIQFGSINQDIDLSSRTPTAKSGETSNTTGAPASPSGITFGTLSGTTMKFESQPFVPQQRRESAQSSQSDSQQQPQQQQGYNNNNGSRHYSGQRHQYNPNKHSANTMNTQSGGYIHTKKNISPHMGSTPSPNQHMAHGWGSSASGHIPPQSYYHPRPQYDAQRAYYGFENAGIPLGGPPQRCVVPSPKKNPIAIIDPVTRAEVPVGNKIVTGSSNLTKDAEKPMAPPKVVSKAIPIINPNKEKIEREEAERKAKEEAERKAKEEAELKAKEEAERKAKEEAELKAKEEAERKAKEEAERKAKEEAERKAKEEAELKAKEEAERKAKEEAERKAKEEAELKAKEEAELKAKEEAERKAKEEAELKAKEEAERKAKEEAECKAKEEADRKAKEEAERKLEEERDVKKDAEHKEKEHTVIPEAKAEKIPERLDLSNLSASPDQVPSTPVQPTKSVPRVTRLIEELNAVEYPEEVKGPFGFKDKDGRIKYDSKFLLQFQPLCKETSIDTSIFQEYNYEQSDRGGSRANSRRQGSERGRGPRTPGGGEIGMFRHGSKDGRMEMGKFAGGRPLTHRTGSGRDGLPSPGGMQREGSRSRSGRGGKRHAGRGEDKRDREEKQQPGGPTIAPEDVVPLEKSETRWVPLSARKKLESQATEDPERMSDELIIRKVKGLLNKLTIEKFDSISDQIWAYAEQSTKEDDGRALRIVITLTFDKACDESAFSAMWAQLCEKLCNNMTDDFKDVSIHDKEGKVVRGAHLFRKYLLNRCQSDFERGWKFNLPEVDESKPDMLTDEYYAAVKAKRHGLGLVQFIGELFKRRMLTDRIMMQCFNRLCADPKEVGDEETETMCKLMTTVGKNLDVKATRGFVDAYFMRMQEMLESPKLSSRVRFKIMDVFDLRKNKWVSRRGGNIGPTTIAEIHEQAQKAKDEQKEAMKRTSSSRGSLPHTMPRTGSHRGAGARDLQRENSSSGGSGPGGNKDASSSSADGWNTVSGSPSGTIKGSRVNELANFGKTDRSKTRSNVLGPSNSPFASLNRVNSKAGDQKNSASDERPTNMNMFSALGGETDDHDHDHDHDHDNDNDHDNDHDATEDLPTEHEHEDTEPRTTPTADSNSD